LAAHAGRPPELAEVFREHAPPLEQLGRDLRRVVRDIVSCRTPLLGGHLQVCDHCGRQIPFYNSCRNRHCPKCQSLEQTRWVEAQTRSLLPVEYFHLVFTVPTALHPFFLAERRGSYALLFEAALETLHDVCRRRLGALPGTIAVLHTWTQTLAFHPHVHCIVTGGGLATSGDRWIACRPGFLVPVRVLSRVFRGKLLDRFDRALQTRTSGLGDSLGRQLLRQAASKEWVVYSKAPLAGPAPLRYLGRYTHRIAIGNERLVAFTEGRVTFRYRDRKRGDASRLLTLEGPDFVQRFLWHVLPRGFVRVRHFGLQANGCRSRLIPRVRQLLHAPAPPQTDNTHRESWQDLYRRLTGRDPARCPYCNRGTLRLVAIAPQHEHERGP
jgi:putative transposase/transposase-like zinc-binding protein